jgi:CRISPR-associated protein Cst2
MSLHIFANIVTPFGTAANNRGDNQGSNVTPLQKILWLGEPHTTVSAEAIRFAFRRCLKKLGAACNRNWAEHPSEIPPNVAEQMQKALKDGIKTPCGYFVDPDFAWYRDAGATGFADDDLLGFMSADAGREEVEASGDATSVDEVADDDAPASPDKTRRTRKRLRGTNYIRRAVLEVTRAVSLTPWSGDVTFNAASPGATPSAQKKGSNPVPYGTELHATRYQYGIALTPERLRDKSRAAKAIKALCELGTVAGNHGRFLFDFSPDAIVIRVTDDPAPRLLYCFEMSDDGKTIVANQLVARLESGDIALDEIIFGVSDMKSPLAQQLGKKDIPVRGVKSACEAAVAEINKLLGVKE